MRNVENLGRFQESGLILWILGVLAARFPRFWRFQESGPIISGVSGLSPRFRKIPRIMVDSLDSRDSRRDSGRFQESGLILGFSGFSGFSPRDSPESRPILWILEILPRIMVDSLDSRDSRRDSGRFQESGLILGFSGFSGFSPRDSPESRPILWILEILAKIPEDSKNQG